MILTALLRAFPTIFRPEALRLLAKSLLLTLVVFAGLGAGLWWLFHGARLYFGWGQGAQWGGFAEATATALVMIAAGWLLFRAVAMAVMGLFADDIVVAVERAHYPQAAARARPIGVGRSLGIATRSLLRALGWNLLALPFYLVLLVTGIGTIGLFLAVNAVLLGRDMAEMVEPRHPDLPPLSKSSRWLMGLVSALLFLVPLLNLLAPIWSAAMAVHMLHGRGKKTP
ncbi:MAG: EI24 domain-containing protein [Sphingobium sp.]